MNSTQRPFSARSYRALLSALLCATVCLGFAVSAHAQQKDKKKNKDVPPVSDGKPIIAMTDEQQIDYMISAMLGAWQLGDVDQLHKFYADDVTVVNGGWGPPIIGWANFVPLYQQQRSRMQHVRMDRDNTFIKVKGNIAWACYQWEFSATLDGQPSASRGQTTLIAEKRDTTWLIVLNHTSIIQAVTQAQPPASGIATPQGAQPQPQPSTGVPPQ
jgi:ketosteroid isomerase-like protein